MHTCTHARVARGQRVISCFWCICNWQEFHTHPTAKATQSLCSLREREKFARHNGYLLLTNMIRRAVGAHTHTSQDTGHLPHRDVAARTMFSFPTSAPFSQFALVIVPSSRDREWRISILCTTMSNRFVVAVCTCSAVRNSHACGPDFIRTVISARTTRTACLPIGVKTARFGRMKWKVHATVAQRIVEVYGPVKLNHCLLTFFSCTHHVVFCVCSIESALRHNKSCELCALLLCCTDYFAHPNTGIVMDRYAHTHTHTSSHRNDLITFHHRIHSYVNLRRTKTELDRPAPTSRNVSSLWKVRISCVAAARGLWL